MQHDSPFLKSNPDFSDKANKQQLEDGLGSLRGENTCLIGTNRPLNDRSNYTKRFNYVR